MDKENLEKLIETEQRSKSNTHRLDKLEENTEALTDIATSVKVMASEQKHISTKLDDMDSRLHVIEEKPSKTLDSFSKAFIAAIGSGIAGIVIAKIFM